ncbi:MAG: tRNA dihydrouridine synthase DusB, partial [Acutalibacteraceae bacterium]
MDIGTLHIDGKAVLAPLAGVADRAMREICLNYGAAMVTTEMVSAKGFTMGDRKSEALLTLAEDEHPAAIQLFGDDPAILADAARKALVFHPDAIDLNMGCPAPKIVNNGGGSALLKDPAKAQAIAKAVVDAVDIPVTVKFRIGWDPDHNVAVEMGKRMEDAGVAAITVHGRTREQMYAPPVDTASIRAVKAAVTSIPVIANGDVRNGLSAAKLLEATDCDAVMVGRGAMGRPWVFQQINGFLAGEHNLPEPPVSERMRVMMNHATLLCQYKGEYIGMREARKHAAWYIKGVRGAAKFRNEIGRISSMEDLALLAIRVISSDAEDRQKNGDYLP